MAYQPKSYRKFVATAATATLVASAVAPAAFAASFTDVADKYKEAVDYLVTNGISQGATETTFGTSANIKRGDAAIWLANALKLDLTNVPASGFSDTGRYDAAVSALKAKGVLSGKTETTFAPNALLTRGEMAKVLANAYNLKSDAQTPFTDLGPNFGAHIAALYANKITEGKTETTFGTSENITRGDLAIFLMRAATLTATPDAVTVKSISAASVVDKNTIEVTFDAALKAEDVKASDFSIEGVEIESATIKAAAAADAVKTVVVLKTKTELKVDGKYEIKFKGASSDVTKVEYKVDAAKVTGVTVTNAKTLKVALEKELANLDGLTFTVKRGTTTIVLTAKLLEDKKSVELASTSNLVAGDYTVEVTGGKFVAGSNSATVTVAAQKVAKLEVLSTKAVKSATTNDTVTVGYSVKDQYGTDITKDALAANVNWSSSVGTATDDNNGKVTIDKNAEIKTGDTIVLTAVDPASGTTAVATLTASDAAALQSLTFGAIKYPTNKTRVEANVAAAADLEVTGLDQYGNAVATQAELNAQTTIIDSDANASASFVVVDGKSYLRLDTTGVTTAKKVIVTVVIKATGQTVNYTFDVVKAPEAAELSVTAPTATIANGDAAGTLAAALTVKDQFGGDLTADQVAANAAAFTITSSNSLVIASADLGIATSGTNKGKLVNNGAFVGAGTTTITVTVNATGKSSSFLLDVKAARAASTIELPTTLAGHLVQGATLSTKLSFKDQYAAAFDATGDITDRAVKVSVTKVSGDDAGLSVSVAGQTTTGDAVTVANESLVDATGAFTIDTVAGKKGSYTVTFQYVNTANNNEVLSQVSKTFVVAENVSTGLTYAVADLPTLYKGGSAFDSNAANITTVDTAQAYAKEISITATDASGNTYVIPTSAIVSVSSNNSKILVQEVAGKWYVAGSDSAITTDVTGQVSVVINTNDGVKTITKDVKVSAQELAAQTVEVKNKAVGSTSVSDVTAFEVTSSTATKDSVFVWVADQFGGYSLGTTTFDSIQLVSLTGTVGGTATLTGGVLDLSAVTSKDNGDKFRVIFIKQGKSDYVDITIKN